MSHWVKKVFIDVLPRFLFIERPPESPIEEETRVDFSMAHSELLPFGNPYKREFKPSHANVEYIRHMYGQDEILGKLAGFDMNKICEACAKRQMQKYPNNVHKAVDGLAFVANHVKSENEGRRASDDWKYVSRVVDRILLILYMLVCFLGGMSILLNAPTLYDGKQPIEEGI